MKIILNSSSNEFIERFSLRATEREDAEIIPTRSEKELFDEILKERGEAFILENGHFWVQKAIDFIKRKSPYVPIILIMDKRAGIYEWKRGAEFYLFNPQRSIDPEDLFESIYRNIKTYNTNFEKLQNLTAKLKEEIEFGEFKYDPVRRNFRYKNKLVKKMSPKEGGVLEILASNFGSIVRKEIIMEKVWHSIDFYVGRSMDVYLTNLRNLFKKENIPLSIKNIHNSGLIMEHEN